MTEHSKVIEKFLLGCTVCNEESAFWPAHSVLEEAVKVYNERVLREFGELPMAYLKVHIEEDWDNTTKLAIECEYSWGNEWWVASFIAIRDVYIKVRGDDIRVVIVAGDVGDGDVRSDLYSPNIQALVSGLMRVSGFPGRRYIESRKGRTR